MPTPEWGKEVKFSYDIFNANNEPCDAPEGPCCCGAFHSLSDWEIKDNVIVGMKGRIEPSWASPVKKSKNKYECVIVEIPDQTYTETYHKARYETNNGGILTVIGTPLDCDETEKRMYKIWSNVTIMKNCTMCDDE